jgi:hypothetical protein
MMPGGGKQALRKICLRVILFTTNSQWTVLGYCMALSTFSQVAALAQLSMGTFKMLHED